VSRTVTRRVVTLNASALADAMESEANRLRRAASEAALEGPARSLLMEAVVETLRGMGQTVTSRIAEDGTTVLHGTNHVESTTVDVRVDPTSGVLEVTTDDPNDSVHPLHPQAGQVCRPAVELAVEFHRTLADHAAQAGLDLGRVTSHAEPLRSAAAAASPGRRAAGRHSPMRAAHRSTP
jgi:hypothetical protein